MKEACADDDAAETEKDISSGMVTRGWGSLNSGSRTILHSRRLTDRAFRFPAIRSSGGDPCPAPATKDSAHGQKEIAAAPSGIGPTGGLVPGPLKPSSERIAHGRHGSVLPQRPLTRIKGWPLKTIRSGV